MATLFILILTLLGLVVAGFFLPVLWIVAVVMLVLGAVYLVQVGRSTSREGTRRS